VRIIPDLILFAGKVIDEKKHWIDLCYQEILKPSLISEIQTEYA
jgi:hypothetical protein